MVPPPPLRALRPLAEAGRGAGRGTAPTPSGGAELLAASAAPPLGPPLEVHPWASVGRTAEASLAQPAARGAWWEVEPQQHGPAHTRLLHTRLAAAP